VYGNVGIAQPVSVYFNTPQPVTGTFTLAVPQPPFQIYGSAQGVQVYGNVGVAQPVSVYFQTPQSLIVSVPQPPFQVYGSAQGVQVYGNVGVAQPIGVYFSSPQSITESNQPQPPFQIYGSAQGVQVYGNIGVAQPVSVYFSTPQKVVAAQPVQVYGTAGALAVSVYDTQLFSDANQVFSGQIGAGAGQNLQIVPPQAGLSFQASLIDLWNIYGVAESVALRYGVAGNLRFIKKLNPDTGFVINLINSTWRGPTNTGLFVYAWEAMGGPLSASGGFVTYTVMGQYLP
jgi:hypothetical protein